MFVIVTRGRRKNDGRQDDMRMTGRSGRKGESRKSNLLITSSQMNLENPCIIKRQRIKYKKRGAGRGGGGLEIGKHHSPN